MASTAEGQSHRFTPEHADRLAARLLGQMRTRLGGLELNHARRVAATVSCRGDDQLVSAALLHDVLEKTDTTREKLLELTDDEVVVELVSLVTRDPREAYREYLQRCASDPGAYALKKADLQDKLVTADVTVPGNVAARLRRQARQRLQLLNLFARWKEELR
jgi:(p)ppGpp synthase/HD superfamily hydrolase